MHVDLHAQKAFAVAIILITTTLLTFYLQFQVLQMPIHGRHRLFPHFTQLLVSSTLPQRKF